MTHTAIATDGLTKTFRQRWSGREVQAVRGVSLEVERGTTFGLLGANGAGKTTFIKMLLSATHSTAGRAMVFGRDVREATARLPVGYLPENHRFPTYFTGEGMLDFYGALSGLDAGTRRQRIPELLQLVGLGEWGSVKLGKYSKGMLQRVGLAQALLHSPQLLILDEPSDGVDPVGRIKIREILQSLEARGVTIFINSHLLMEVEAFCREVAIMHKGQVVLRGNVRELTAGKGYRVSAVDVPERLVTDAAALGTLTTRTGDGATFHFASREATNQALDLLRGGGAAIEAVIPTTSTLEEVFVKTVEQVSQ